MVLWLLLASAAIGYLLGNFQTGLVVGWASRKIDLRMHGSGGTGATNALRTLGKGGALLTFLGDFVKGTIASLLGLAIAGQEGQLVASLFAVIGHIWPVFFRFRGGKGVTTSVGSMVIAFPVPVACAAAVSIALMALTRYVSLANIAAEFCFGIYAIVWGVCSGNALVAIIGALIPALVIFAHRTNIRRLLNGKENKLSFKKAGKA